MNNYSAVPEELRILKNWVLWKRIIKPGDTEPSKVPHKINGRWADPTDPDTWSTFEECFNVFSLGNYDGLGFVFTNSEYAGIDLDDPSFLDDKITPNPNYQIDMDRQIKIAREFDSYSEVSPSGKGLHIIVKGSVPSGINNKKANVEIYSTGRYFTITGKVHNPKPIADYQELLNLLWSQMGGKIEIPIENIDGEETSTDEEILALAEKYNGDKFIALAKGDMTGYPTQSEADLAYMDIIAYYTNSKSQVIRIYSQSKLAQIDKKRKHKGYLNRTVNKAFDQKIPNIDIEGLKAEFHKKLNGHSLRSVAQLVEPTAHNGLVASSNLATPTIDYELPPGLLGEIANFIYAAAPRPVKEIALAGAIGLMAGICGRAYNVSGTGLNQYVLLLAMTGAGKEAAASGINKLMNTIKMQVPTSTSFIGPSEISSGAALFKYLGNQSQSFISLLGEFGLRLQQMSSPNANGSEVSLRRMFLDLYNKSGASETLHASVYSDKANNTSAVPSPSFSLLGESTPERFYGALNEDMISEGLLPRFLLIEYKGNRPPLNEQHAFVTPSTAVVSQLVTLAAYCETINHNSPRKPIDVQATSEAAKLLHDFDKFADAKINSSGKEVIRQLWNRAHIKVLKLSALIAVGENYLVPTINQHSMQWAAKLVEADIAALTERFEAGEIGGNSLEITQAKEAIRIFREYIDKGPEYIHKYGAVQFQHENKVINNNVLNRRLSALGPFRNDKLGKTAALKRTLQNLIDAGKIVELKGKEFEKYKTTGKLYFICPDILND